MAAEETENWEIELIGETNNFCPIIKDIARELNISDYALEAKQVEQETTISSTWFNIFSFERKYPLAILIGVVTLKSIGSNRTILRISPRSEWSRYIEGDELLHYALVLEDEKDRTFYDAQFATYIECLHEKLKNYGLKQTWYKRLWRVIKELVGIAKAAKP